MSFVSDFRGNGMVCENERWQLCWDAAKKRVSFEDKATGVVWGPTPNEAVKTAENSDGMPVKSHPQVESDLLVYYHNPATQEEKVALSATDAVAVDGIYTQRMDNGLRVIYDFIELEIAVPVEYTIEENRFLITVRPESIADNGESYVTAVALAPFLCGIENSRKDAWMFLPDGSGALIAPTELGTVGTIGSADIYGGDLAVHAYDYLSTVQQLSMPVYGVKKGEAALLAVIDSGAEAASLAWNIGSTNIRYSSVYPVFRIRGYSLIEAPRGFSSPLTEIKVFAKEISTVPLRVAGYPLFGKSADIAGMAHTYQSYLIQHGGLTQRAKSEKYAAFKFVGGLELPGLILGLPTIKLFPLTTTDDAIHMAEELTAELGTNFYVSLVGFGTSGADVGKFAGGYTVADVLGGEKGMRELTGAFQKSGLDCFMDFNLVAFKKASSGFSKSDVAVLPNGQIAWFSSFNTVTRDKNNDRFFLLSRDRLNDAAGTLMKRAGVLGLTGVSLDSLSHTAYSDYASQKAGVSAEMSDAVTSLFQTVRQGGLRVLADSANDYAVVAADAVIDAPLYSSGYDFSFADVPFYEMVFKGFIPMSSVSINLCADEDDALLRCVEVGISPSYTLLCNYDRELITSQHSFVFSSAFAGVKERAVRSVKELAKYLESVRGATISGYTLRENVRITQFDNGVYTAVNYGNQIAETEYGDIPPRAFVTGRETK